MRIQVTIQYDSEPFFTGSNRDVVFELSVNNVHCAKVVLCNDKNCNSLGQIKLLEFNSKRDFHSELSRYGINEDILMEEIQDRLDLLNQ
jgi:hypothetical protein